MPNGKIDFTQLLLELRACPTMISGATCMMLIALMRCQQLPDRTLWQRRWPALVVREKWGSMSSLLYLDP